MNKENEAPDPDVVAADHLRTAALMGWDISQENKDWLKKFDPEEGDE